MKTYICLMMFLLCAASEIKSCASGCPCVCVFLFFFTMFWTINTKTIMTNISHSKSNIRIYIWCISVDNIVHCPCVLLYFYFSVMPPTLKCIFIQSVCCFFYFALIWIDILNAKIRLNYRFGVKNEKNGRIREVISPSTICDSNTTSATCRESSSGCLAVYVLVTSTCMASNTEINVCITLTKKVTLWQSSP